MAQQIPGISFPDNLKRGLHDLQLFIGLIRLVQEHGLGDFVLGPLIVVSRMQKIPSRENARLGIVPGPLVEFRRDPAPQSLELQHRQT